MAAATGEAPRIAAGFLLLFLGATSSEAEARKRYPEFSVGINWGVRGNFSGAVARLVENVPADLRTVPSHENDTWIYGKRQVLRTIPFDSIEPNPVGAMGSFYIGPEVTVRRLRLRTSVNFSWFKLPEQGLTKSNEGATRQVNQRGLPERGFGTSLVYYNMYATTSAYPGWSGEAGVNLSRNVSLVAGAGFNSFKLEIESGYDRFDRLETYASYKAATVRLWQTYGGVEVEFPGESGHAVAIQVLAGGRTDPVTANGMTVSQDGRWGAVIGLAFRHTLSRK